MAPNSYVVGITKIIDEKVIYPRPKRKGKTRGIKTLYLPLGKSIYISRG
jgi:hypothetical protein